MTPSDPKTIVGTGTHDRGEGSSRLPESRTTNERTPLLRATGDSPSTSALASASRSSSSSSTIQTGNGSNDDEEEDHGRRESFLSSATLVVDRGEEEEDGDTSGKETRISKTKEVRVLIKYSIPILIANLFSQSLGAMTLISLGHLSTSSLAAASLSTLTWNILCMSILQGFTSALDSLCPQAFSSTKPDLTGLFAVRMGVVLVFIESVIVMVFWNAKGIFLAIGQDLEVAKLAGIYLKVICFALPAIGAVGIMRRWLQAQGLMMGPTISIFIASPVNAFFNWLLVWGPSKFRLGFIGAPISLVISFNLVFIICLLYCLLFVRQTTTAWRRYYWKEIFDLNGIWMIVGLGFKGMMMTASEWWSWEIVALASSYLGSSEFASQSILITSLAILTQPTLALGMASAVRVGNHLGAGKSKLAKASADVAMIMATVVGIFNSVLLMGLRERWGFLFSSDHAVVRIVAGVLPLMVLFQLADSLVGCGMGVLRGAGKPGAGAIINLVAYYILGLPIAFLLTFATPKSWTSTHHHIRGLWFGLTSALICSSVLTCCWIWRTDWEKEAENAAKMVESAEQEGDDDADDAGIKKGDSQQV